MVTPRMILLQVLACGLLFVAAAHAATVIDFSGYTGGSVEQWLKGRSYQFESDAKKRDRLGINIKDGVLSLEAKRPMSGFILNDSVNLDNIQSVKITWGIGRYPKETSYENRVNNEALMVYFFFGKEKVSSGHVLIPNSPYFIGLFLCQDEKVNFAYKGRYFHTGGRFVCLSKPPPGQMITSEFNLDTAFRSYFGKAATPALTGIGLAVDTTQAADGGRSEAFIKSIEFAGSK